MLKKYQELVSYFPSNTLSLFLFPLVILLQLHQSLLRKLSQFLPNQLGEEETIKACDEAISITEAKSLKEIGKVIKYLKENSSTALDISLASKIIKEKLQNL